MTRLHHVNVVVPHNGTAAALAFYVDVLRLRPVPKDPAVGSARGAWLELGDGTQLHLSERDGAGHPDAHLAVTVDDLDAVLGRLAAAAAGWEPQPALRGARRGFTRDPAGNRVELLEPTAAPADAPGAVVVVTRHAIAAVDGSAFLTRAGTALDVLAGRPGFRSGRVGRSADDPTAWTVITEWAGVAAWRRALSSYDVKVHATPLLADASDESGAYEVLLARPDDVATGSVLAADAGDVRIGEAAGPGGPSRPAAGG